MSKSLIADTPAERVDYSRNDSDDEQCALSDKWQYERKSRRWSRVVEITPQAQRRLQVIAARALAEREAREARGETEDDEDDSLPTIRVGLVDADGRYTDLDPELSIPLSAPTHSRLNFNLDSDLGFGYFQSAHACTIQRTKLCRSGLPAKDVMRRFNTPPTLPSPARANFTPLRRFPRLTTLIDQSLNSAPRQNKAPKAAIPTPVYQSNRPPNYKDQRAASVYRRLKVIRGALDA
ncbi:hypothetical protein EVAR_93567_1 [Eumeta japonica]|uniref:Uncharacterized protein n=1 Tax=Eumeta variegata TaxID=151549 RepID=A0A4C1USG3_EUMVA|nr:hypothetical protein EVAR_93567_1 [Eumeta japonica]